MEGIFAVYKPKGPTSNDIVQQIKRLSGGQKVGHAGTLDPLASGVLVIGVGRASTKQLGEIVAKEKEYVATIRLGYESTTDDAEGEKTKVAVIDTPTRQTVDNVVASFVGQIQQVPPRYSAVKVNGQEAYKLMRRGAVVNLAPRPVMIQSIRVESYRWPTLVITVTTGPGTYIRSLARDIGQTLSVGGYLADLERTRVGQFTKHEAKTINDVIEM